MFNQVALHPDRPLHDNISYIPPKRLKSRSPRWRDSVAVDVSSRWREDWQSNTNFPLVRFESRLSAVLKYFLRRKVADEERVVVLRKVLVSIATSAVPLRFLKYIKRSVWYHFSSLVQL